MVIACFTLYKIKICFIFRILIFSVILCPYTLILLIYKSVIGDFDRTSYSLNLKIEVNTFCPIYSIIAPLTALLMFINSSLIVYKLFNPQFFYPIHLNFLLITKLILNLIINSSL